VRQDGCRWGRAAQHGPLINAAGGKATQPAVYLAALYASEVGAAERLAALTQAFPSRLSDLPPAFISIDPSLSAEQQAAIRAALSHPVSVLTGGPGTGKTRP
jgi:exodeoxyribonuclease V alpha subunit